MKLSMKAENAQMPVMKKFKSKWLVTASVDSRSLTSFVPISNKTKMTLERSDMQWDDVRQFRRKTPCAGVRSIRSTRANTEFYWGLFARKISESATTTAFALMTRHPLRRLPDFPQVGKLDGLLRCDRRIGRPH
jgi:hypothetical protein